MLYGQELVLPLLLVSVVSALSYSSDMGYQLPLYILIFILP
jgi:hypothetical protein